MSNSYTKTAFELTMLPDEFKLLKEVVSVSEMLAWHETSNEDLPAKFDECSQAFRDLFPAVNGNSFERFLELFDDPDYPVLDFDIDQQGAHDDGQVSVVFTGEQFSPEVAASVIQRVCRSALPCGFDYAFDHDKLRLGELGGGFTVVTAEDVSFGTTSQSIDRALARFDDEGSDGFVLVIRNSEHGLSFWNVHDGFGRLRLATVFSEREAAAFDIPFADDQPEWLAMPAPLSP